jgi:GNAT superfamily N-acetyltransferase
MRFLYETFRKSSSYENWFPDRFENSIDLRAPRQWARHIRVWEKVDDKVRPQRKEIVAVANPEGPPEGSPCDYFLQVNPAYDFLERQMLEWIEAHFREMKKDRTRKEKLKIHVLEGNIRREDLLAHLGYQRDGASGLLRVRTVTQPIPESVCPEGYKIRTVSEADYGRLTAMLRLVFGHGEWLNAELYRASTKCSFYLPDLDLVAVASDGTFASFCTFRIDPLSKITSLEPMGTHHGHRRRGLGKALIFEGLRRSMRYNPTLFYIGGAADTVAANRLYDSTGFIEKGAYYAWCKEA